MASPASEEGTGEGWKWSHYFHDDRTLHLLCYMDWLVSRMAGTAFLREMTSRNQMMNRWHDCYGVRPLPLGNTLPRYKTKKLNLANNQIPICTG